MFGKHHTHFLRLCGILKNLKQAIDLLEPPPNSEKSTITDEFAENCDRLISNLDESSFVIELEIAVQANSILEYYNLNKFALSGYEFYVFRAQNSLNETAPTGYTDKNMENSE